MKEQPGNIKTDTKKWLIPQETREALLELFKELKEEVVLELFIREGENDPYNALSASFLMDLSRLSDKIVVHFNSIGQEKARKYVVTHSPTILIQPEVYRIRYTGAPAGEEGRSFVETLLRVSQRKSGLSEASREILAKLNEERQIQVFVNPQCPYCPGQVIHAFKAAIERPDLISSECIDTTEFADLAEKYQVGSVPQTMINGKNISLGLEPEEVFASEVVSLEPSAAEWGPPAAEAVEVDLIIVGAGPAGLTAGIYAERSGLKTIILEKEMVGGQVSVTPVVENYPGFKNIPGKNLIDLIGGHAREYTHIHEGEEVEEIKVGKQIEVLSRRGLYRGKALILATGAGYKKLEVPGESKFLGHGVSYCATCDGYLFRDKSVVVIGGGNSALTDALHLKHLGVKVTLIHRRDAFRAEQHLQESVKKEEIPVLWNAVVDEILGKERLTEVKIRSTLDGTVHNIKTDGVFVAIGGNPNSRLASEIGVALNAYGFIQVDGSGRTNIPRIYAAGDVTGGIRQIVTAVGQGATVALSVFEDISRPYWIKRRSNQETSD